MYKQKISITINSDYDREKIADEFVILMTNFCRTGQIMRGEESPYVNGDEMIAYQTTLEKESLDSKYNDEWVNKRVKNLQEWCNSTLKTEVIGQHLPFDDDICKCTHHESFALFTSYCDESSPIECGTCGRAVPVYKITELADDDRYAIEGWQRDYVSCDRLNMGCRVGEKWTLKQLSDHDSQLSGLGIDVCGAITDATGKPAYYYLFNYRNISPAKDKLRKCPQCSGEWLLAEKWNKFYDFKCDRCKLVSTLTSRS